MGIFYDIPVTEHLRPDNRDYGEDPAEGLAVSPYGYVYIASGESIGVLPFPQLVRVVSTEEYPPDSMEMVLWPDLVQLANRPPEEIGSPPALDTVAIGFYKAPTDDFMIGMGRVISVEDEELVIVRPGAEMPEELYTRPSLQYR
ncbi:hypothetical protein BJX76DRAFT_363168 [Aspergillus varians]